MAFAFASKKRDSKENFFLEYSIGNVQKKTQRKNGGKTNGISSKQPAASDFACELQMSQISQLFMDSS